MRIKRHCHRHERPRPRLLEGLCNKRNMASMHSVKIADSNQRSTGWRRKILVSGHELGRHANAIYYLTAILPSSDRVGAAPKKTRRSLVRCSRPSSVGHRQPTFESLALNRWFGPHQ